MATAEKIKCNGCEEDPFLNLDEIEQIEKIIIEVLGSFKFEVESWSNGSYHTGDMLVFGYHDGPRWQLRLYNSGQREFILKIFDAETRIYSERSINYDQPLLRQRIVLYLTSLFD